MNKQIINTDYPEFSVIFKPYDERLDDFLGKTTSDFNCIHYINKYYDY